MLFVPTIFLKWNLKDIVNKFAVVLQQSTNTTTANNTHSHALHSTGIPERPLTPFLVVVMCVIFL